MIELNCSRCGHQLRIDDRYAGTQGRCKHCGANVHVPKSEYDVPPPLPADSERTKCQGGLAERRQVLAVAKYQRLLIILVLINLVVNIGLISTLSAPAVSVVFMLASLLLFPAIVVALWKLGRALQMHPAILVLLGVISIVPGAALFVLLMLNTSATKVLREREIPVGFWGAKRDALPVIGDDENVPDATGQAGPLKHSVSGISSLVISITSLLLFIALSMGAAILEVLSPRMGEQDAEVILMFLGFFVVGCFLLSVLALTLGLVGVFTKNRKKGPAIAGLSVSAATLLLMVVLAIAESVQ